VLEKTTTSASQLIKAGPSLSVDRDTKVSANISEDTPKAILLTTGVVAARVPLTYIPQNIICSIITKRSFS